MGLVSVYHAQCEAEAGAAQALLLDAGIHSVLRRTEHIEFAGLGQVMEGMHAEISVAGTDAARARRILGALGGRLGTLATSRGRPLPLASKLAVIARQTGRAFYPLAMALLLPLYLLYELGASVLRKLKGR